MANTLRTREVITKLNPKKKTKTTTEKLQGQVNNYKTRLEAAGQDTDKRNWLEKKLNLPEGQNALFDIFEIIGRPQQALFGAIDAAQTGEDVWEDFKRGLGGAKTTSGGQLLRNAGMGGSGEFNLFDPSSYGEASLSDVLGFGLDLFADPIDLALWASVPATGGATAPVAIGKTAADTAKVADTVSDVAKIAKAADTATDVAKTAKVVDTATDVAKAAKVVDNATDVAKAAKVVDTATDAGKAAQKTKIVFKPFAKESKSTLELALGELGKGVKKGAKVSDNVIEKVLGNIDAKNAKKYADAVEKYGAAAARDTYKLTDKLGSYKQLKKGLASAVDYTKALPGDIIKKATRNEAMTDFAREQIEGVMNDVSKDAKALAKKSLEKEGIKVTEDALARKTNEIVNDFTKYVEKDYKLENSINSVLSNISKKNKTIKADADGIKAIRETLDKIPAAKGSYEVLEDSIKFNDKFLKNKSIILNDSKYKDLLQNTKVTQAKNYTKEQLAHHAELAKNKDFTDLVEKHKGSFENASKAIKEATGFDLSEITGKEGYVKKAKGNMSKDYENFVMGRSSSSGSKTNKSRKYASGEEAINAVKEKELSKAKSLDVREKQLRSQLSSNKKKMLKDQISEIKIRQEKVRVNLNKNMNKIDESTAKLIKTRETLENTKNIIKNQLTDDIINKVSKMQDEALSDGLFNASNKLVKQTERYNDLLNKFYTEGLTDAQLNKYAKQIDELDKSIKQSTAVLEGKIAMVKSSIDDSTIKEIEKVSKSLDKYSAIDKKLETNIQKSKKLSDMKDILRTSYNDKLATYDDMITVREAKLRGINKAADAKINEELKEIARQKSMLANHAGEELFDMSFTAGLKEFMDSELQRSVVANNYRDALLEGTLRDKNVIKYTEDLEKLPDGSLKIPKGWVKVNGKDVYDNIDSFKNLIPDNSETLLKYGREVKGKALYMPKEAAAILDVAPKTKQEVGAFVKFVNGWNNTFKRFKTLTPGFHLRNITGNASNMYLSGVPMKDIPVYYGKAIQALNGAKDLIAKESKVGFDALTKAEQKQFNLIKEFAETGFFKKGTVIQELEDIEKSVRKGSKNVPGKVLNKASEISMNMNTAMDNYSRMALYMYAKDNPAYVAKLGKESAADAVKFALFDPSNMTAAEKKYMRNIVPFYNFTKQNLLFQSSNIIKNTTKYKRLAKAINMSYDGLDENSYYQYQKEGFQIPTPFKDSNGNQLFMKTNLPLSDLGEYLSNPVQRGLSSVTPIIKAPIEKVTGMDLFTGQELSTKGSSINNLLNTLGVDSSKFDLSAIDRIANYLGINTISTDLIKKINAVIDSDKSDNEKWAEILRSMLQNTNEDKVQNNKLYQELEYYQNRVSSLKNQGIDIPTIKELTEQSKSNLNRLKKKRASNN